MKWLAKFLKGFIYSAILLVLMFVSFALISGNTYLFFLVRNTIFKGRLGPDINEYGIYHNRKVAKEDPQPWPTNFIDAELSPEDLNYLTSNESVAFLVIQNDQIIFEWESQEYQDTFHYNLWSATKSIVSMLIGCAIDDGYIKGVGQPVEDFFPEKFKNSGVTIEHVLTMSSGINFTESYLNPFSHAARGLYDNDLVALHEKYHPEETPGETFKYLSGNTQLLAMILIKATGKPLAEYASERLWQRIGAEQDAYWSLDHEDGMERAFCCFNTNARDFARIGKLALHQGVWDGDTIIDPNYMRVSVTPADLKDADGNDYNSYGYQWWTLDLEDYQGFYARGIQGQYAFVLPQENLIIVRMGHKRNTIPDRGHIKDVFKYLDMGRNIAAQRDN